ncbi:hypothetical protein J4E08_23430 [Sagittula sp. NFXS13]|uniref:hypothetical protein n=1 Tax=Sagittula sp. NFXS13 TaxID=2819095 RepID=UPI0032DEED89
MTDTIVTQAEPALVAIDIAKVRHKILLSVPGKKRCRHLNVLNQCDYFNRLITTLSDCNQPVRAAFEGEAGGVPPLKWSTFWNIIIPFSEERRDGWQTREARGYRAETATS